MPPFQEVDSRIYLGGLIKGMGCSEKNKIKKNIIFIYLRKFLISPTIRLLSPWVTVPLGRTSVEIIQSDLFERGCTKDSVLALGRPLVQQRLFHCSNFRLVGKGCGNLSVGLWLVGTSR